MPKISLGTIDITLSAMDVKPARTTVAAYDCGGFLQWIVNNLEPGETITIVPTPPDGEPS